MRFLRRGDRASTLDLLVAGLGNPGREYDHTRHNAGWLVLDELACRHDGSFRSKFSGQLSEVRLGEEKTALLKPETYMNESGRSIAAAAGFFKVDPGVLLVVHDDVDLEPGRLQARLGGGLAGHNGLRSIAQALRTNDFQRPPNAARRPRGGGTGAASPTTCSRGSARSRTSMPSSRGRLTPSRRSPPTGSRKPSAASTRQRRSRPGARPTPWLRRAAVGRAATRRRT